MLWLTYMVVTWIVVPLALYLGITRWTWVKGNDFRRFFAIGALAIYGLWMAAHPLVAIYQWSTATCEPYTVGKTWIKGNPASGDQQYLVRLVDASGKSEVARVEDSFWWMTYDASNRWSNLSEGKKTNLKLAGLRVELFSMYPNVVRQCQ